jgi:23S rRNA (uracil1939-C5)-methyltransferase
MARPKRGERLSLTIDDLAFGGEGVGRADGYVVFVPGGVPGDRVRVRLDQARSRFGRGLIEEIERLLLPRGGALPLLRPVRRCRLST